LGSGSYWAKKMSKNKINTTAATAASAETNLIEVKSKVRLTIKI